MIRTILTLLLLVSTAFAQMGVSNGHDLDALWTEARDAFDVDAHDAVLLLESRTETITEDGDLVTRIHRVVHVSTRAGQNAHADLRIPWNSATSTFEVVKLRTWRDDRWWPDADRLSDTAVVETLPHAVRTVWDMQDLRETMLLHDGVEAPCIMETEYVITERGGALPGVDGSFVFARREPAVLVQYAVTTPGEVRHRSLNGAPQPAIGGGGQHWTMRNVPARPLPDVDAAAYAPTVEWTTWESDGAVIDYVNAVVDRLLPLEPAMLDSMAVAVAGVATPVARVRAVVDLVDETVRRVRYHAPDRALRARDALRTWNTAYADDLDRAVLQLAVLLEAGVESEIGFAVDRADPGRLPGLRGTRPLVVMAHPSMVLDPAHDELLPLRAVELVVPVITEPAAAPHDRFWTTKVDVTLARDDDGWTGTGSLVASGSLSPWPDAEVHGAGVEGARVDDVAHEWFDDDLAVATFATTLAAPDPDALGRLRFDLAGVPGGVRSLLPRGVETWRETRTSPVDLGPAASQSATLRLTLGAASVVHAPESMELVNDAGRFAVAVSESDGVLTIIREFELAGGVIAAEAWPALRALLLAEADPAHRTILLRED